MKKRRSKKKPSAPAKLAAHLRPEGKEQLFRITNPGSSWSALVGATEVGLGVLRAVGGNGDELLKAKCGFDLVTVGLHRMARPLIEASIVMSDIGSIIAAAEDCYGFMPPLDGSAGLRLIECGGFDFGTFSVEQEPL